MDASLALRISCKLDDTEIREKIKSLLETWKNLDSISQEQMTRLRVSAVFHRTMEEQCQQLKELKETIESESESENKEEKLLRLRLHMLNREQLILEIGRMVRLGKLLRSRLKEPFSFEPGYVPIQYLCYVHSFLVSRTKDLFQFLIDYTGKLKMKAIQHVRPYKMLKAT